MLIILGLVWTGRCTGTPRQGRVGGGRARLVADVGSRRPSTASSARAGPRTIRLAGRPSAVSAGGDGRGAEVEQVAEVGVVAERRCWSRSGRPAPPATVNVVPMVGSTSTSIAGRTAGATSALSSASRYWARNTSDGVEAGAAADDLLDHGQHVVGWSVEEVAELDQPLGHPGPGVEQLAGGEERARAAACRSGTPGDRPGARGARGRRPSPRRRRTPAPPRRAARRVRRSGRRRRRAARPAPRVALVGRRP